MKNLQNRLSRLEAGHGQNALSPLVRRWLGQSLKPAEHAQADVEARQPTHCDPASLTMEERQWLAV